MPLWRRIAGKINPAANCSQILVCILDQMFRSRIARRSLTTARQHARHWHLGGEQMRDVIRASSLGGFRNLVEELGGDADSIARDAGLNLDSAFQPDKLIPARNLYE